MEPILEKHFKRERTMKLIFWSIFAAVIIFATGYILIGKAEANKEFKALVDEGNKFIAQAKYEQALDAFQKAIAIRKDETVQSKLIKAQAEVNKEKTIEASIKSFNTAIEEQKAGDLLQSLGHFKDVKAQDEEHYETAQQKISEITLLIAQDHLATAKKLYANKSYIDAHRELNIALEYNSEFAEAKALFSKYQTKYKAQLAEQEELERLQEERKQQQIVEKARQSLLKAMNTYESGVGPVSIAVKAKTTKTVNTGYGTYSYSTDGKGWFVHVWVNTLNNGTSPVHVNPIYFTLSTTDGYTVNPDKSMYSLSNYFDATDLAPNSYTNGWLIFYISKANMYTLHYQSLDSSVDKVIVF